MICFSSTLKNWFFHWEERLISILEDGDLQRVPKRNHTGWRTGCHSGIKARNGFPLLEGSGRFHTRWKGTLQIPTEVWRGKDLDSAAVYTEKWVSLCKDKGWGPYQRVLRCDESQRVVAIPQICRVQENWKKGNIDSLFAPGYFKHYENWIYKILLFAQYFY